MRVELVVDGIVRAESFVPWTGPVVQSSDGRGHYVTVGGKMALYWEESTLSSSQNGSTNE